MSKWIYGFKSLRIISEQGIASRGVPEDIPYAYALSLDIIPRMLGAAFEGEDPEPQIKNIGYPWVFEHVLKRHPATAYLRSLPDNEMDRDLHFVRVSDLAELLYNLQTVNGINVIYRRLVSDPSQLEATILELEGLRLLWLAGLPFKLIHTGAEQGLNYECEITLPTGITAYCEMKCKLETTQFSESSVKDTLKYARQHQLPKGGCGIIILKAPSVWFDAPEIVTAFERVIAEEFRSTTRVSEIIYYVRPVVYALGYGASAIVYKEFLNNNASHIASLNGGVLKNGLNIEGTRWLRFDLLNEEKLKQLLAKELSDSS